MLPARPHAEAAQALNRLLSAVLRGRPREISLTALSTLATLERTGPRRITELAVVERVAQPSMTILIGNLERDGLVQRVPDPDDRRVTLAVITDAGVAYMQSRRQQNSELLERLIDRLEDSDQQALDSALRAVVRLAQLDEDERDPAHARD
jgi:DNA-binding MarR family transcriptional regulator